MARNVRRATLLEFDTLWRFIVERSQGFPTVQEYHELEHVFNLMQGCESYLEVGTAEGNSLYVLAHALNKYPSITTVDFGEPHTKAAKDEIIKLLFDQGIGVKEIAGNSHNAIAINGAVSADSTGDIEKFNVVLIDAGHAYEDVIADAVVYGWLATKYIFFHDVCLPEVNRAFEWYCKQRPECTAYKMINSTTFGYGVIKI